MRDSKRADHALGHIDHRPRSDRSRVALHERAGFLVRGVHLSRKARELGNDCVVQVRAVLRVQNPHVVFDVLQARVPLIDDDFHGDIGISHGFQLVQVGMQ